MFFLYILEQYETIVVSLGNRKADCEALATRKRDCEALANRKTDCELLVYEIGIMKRAQYTKGL